ncbi:MAG: M1 family metallopeptidase, partial [Planctomycetota bacterium]
MATRCLASLLFACTILRATEPSSVVHHDLTVLLQPNEHLIEIEDRVTLPEGVERRFRLHAGLEVAGIEANAGAEEERPSGVKLRTYVAPAGGELLLRMRGTIHHPLVAEGEEYARSFSRTPGTIGEEGVVLTGASFWIPDFGVPHLTYRLTVRLPEGWDVVSQGRRTAAATGEGRRTVTWECPHPMEEIYLIAARFTEYSRAAGGVETYAFLRAPDPNLAAKYLETTAQYIEMYRRLIGPYPFSKFALVENFWETGYGMPSFTLLGPKIIRFPFILHSSYPHEILHNWWGNSVYVDWETGNWCEGLTAYLADHLIKEGQGRGAEYRRDTLKKYRNYVRAGKDFPLSRFRSRHSGATEAVGYGKSAMLFHMLRKRLGDPTFVRGLQQFYRAFRFKQASFADLAKVFTEVAGEDLGPFFRQWVDREGAPQLEMKVEPPEGNRLVVEVRQAQEGEPFALRVLMAVSLDGVSKAHPLVLDLTERV